MGYCASQHDAKFGIKYEHHEAALEAIKGLIGSGKETSQDFRTGERSFSWVDSKDLMDARHIESAFDAWGWRVRFFEDPNPDIVSIQFEAEKIGDEAILFEAIAPFVEPGSFIEMLGEDGDRWRWMFDGKTCREVHAKVTWEEPA